MTNYVSPTRWNTILTKLNQKRSEGGFSLVSTEFSGYVKQSNIDTLRNGINEILNFYTYTNLTEALYNVGYSYNTWKSWDYNFIATRSLDEIENILDTMYLVPFPTTTLHARLADNFSFPYPKTYIIDNLAPPFEGWFATAGFGYFTHGFSYGSFEMDATLELIGDGFNVNWTATLLFEILAVNDDLDSSNLIAHAASYPWGMSDYTRIETFIPPFTTRTYGHTVHSGSSIVRKGAHT